MLLAKFVEFVAVGDSLEVRGLQQDPGLGACWIEGGSAGGRELGREMFTSSLELEFEG